MKSFSYSISSLTPIVTGDRDHRNTELQATGLLGSLRYQYWLLKAMQAWQSNPHNPSYPPYSFDLPAKGAHNKRQFLLELAKAGPVVQLFGDTNWKKMFRLEITDAVRGEALPCSARADDRQAQKTPYQWKQINLTFRQDRKISFFGGTEGEMIRKEIEELMAFIHQYGWLGAAPQNGLGWVKVQGRTLSPHTLPSSNPVFAAEDISFTAREARNIVKELTGFFRDKIEKVTESWRKHRYKNSIDYLSQEGPPVGYEIRRWLRDQKRPSFFFGNKNNAGFVHVTHPLIRQDGGWLVRLRFAVRPDSMGRLTPARISPAPDAWLHSCETLLKSI
ncbi:MAG: hypothetical protein SD837_08940 [Candidatus Electrothrix scaldis]|nr:MAG: hypothetical protein SD837_08940 [Candidatus Electrothrix sp. GW3-3]